MNTTLVQSSSAQPRANNAPVKPDAQEWTVKGILHSLGVERVMYHGYTYAYDTNGVTFTTIMVQAETRSAARAAMRRRVKDFIDGLEGVVHVRTEPSVEYDSEDGVWRASLRMSVS